MPVDLGTNLSGCVDWDSAKLPADLMWSARPWATGDGNGDNTANWTAIDSQGWPVVSSGTTFGAIFETNPWPGTYKLSFKTRSGTSGVSLVSSYSGNIQIPNGAGDRTYDAGTNTTTINIVVPSYASGQYIWLRWTSAGTGITDVHLMRPLQDASGWHAIGTPLSDYIIDRLATFSTIRTMTTISGGAGRPAGLDVNWSERVKPWSSQTRTAVAARKGGLAWENLIAAANQANKDLWITLPFYATDDYIEKVAQVMAFGSDGATPYTSTQASPVFAPLAPHLKLYVEHANELWNGWPYWTNENYSLSNAEIAAGDASHYVWNGTGNAWEHSWRRVGWLAVRHSLIFRRIFGNGAMMTRVRPVLATQHGRYGTTDEPLQYVSGVWGAASAYGTINGVTNPRQPASYYLYGLATAPYVPEGNEPLDVTSAATMLDGVVANLASTAAGKPIPAIAWNQGRATTYGIEYIAYEGGNNLIPELMHSTPNGDTTTEYADQTVEVQATWVQRAKDASYDATLGLRMGARITGGVPDADQSDRVYGTLFQAWESAGAGLFCHFTLAQAAAAGSMFGLCPPSATSASDPRLETGPKWDAVKAFAAPIGLTIYAAAPSGGFIRIWGTRPAGSTVGLYRRA